MTDPLDDINRVTEVEKEVDLAKDKEVLETLIRKIPSPSKKEDYINLCNLVSENKALKKEFYGYDIEIIDDSELVDNYEIKKILRKDFAHEFAFACSCLHWDSGVEELYEGLYQMFYENWDVCSYEVHAGIRDSICRLITENSLNKESFEEVISVYKFSIINNFLN